MNNASDYNFTITVYVQEPSSSGGGDSFGFDNGVGHVFIGLSKVSKSNPNDKITQVLGFYPTGLPKGGLWYDGAVHDNGNTNYTIKKTFTVSASDFGAALHMIEGLDDIRYSVYDFNCTNYIFSICDAAGAYLPKTRTLIEARYGSYTPGRLGQDLRDRNSNDPDIIVGNNKAPRSMGSCD
ncbi:hypothetical protein [Fibrella aquatilis]|uniref:Uncharacterized protein n=1 Tax=Fibrella aquatilis TaxID=2817059 RepID=A0A939G6Y9_9BACT|nr:hypothetical protein [Fibrella aquatilis]MBO0932165.1 hypothetical protein [Fibrella aquatilis]